jgi:hypothetical protein
VFCGVFTVPLSARVFCVLALVLLSIEVTVWG